MAKALAVGKTIIRTPDQRLRVFVSSTLHELADERKAAKKAIGSIRLHPVMFEMGARPHPPRELYQAYIEQSHIFIGIYWQKYGWVALDMEISGIEDEFIMSDGKPRLIYIKKPAPEIETQLQRFLNSIQDSGLSYKSFSDVNELEEMIEGDLALLLTERFELGDHAKSVEQNISGERTRLPFPATSIIGRDKEVEELGQILKKPGTRILTLSGPGGIGKSRLALELAWNFYNEFSDGVFYVPLAHISDTELVPSAILQSLFPKDTSLRPSEDVIIEGLQEKNCLILIDNFEQVIDAANILTGIISQCPGVKIMVTSRELLRVSGEREYPVLPLSLPLLKKDLPIAAQIETEISQSPAVQLFVERARAIKAGFSLTKENAEAITGICIKLDGIPLAIELAAARSKIMSPKEMLPHLNKSLSFLTDGSRDMPERHRKLEATIDWSYKLLEEEERQLLRRLSVFSGGFTLSAAWIVASNTDEPDGFKWSRLAIFLHDASFEVSAPYPPPSYPFTNCMESLVSKNMLYTQESAMGETRFYLYNAIAEYAAQRLLEAGESMPIRKNHLIYFMCMAEETSHLLRTRNAAPYYHKLDREMKNMRAALTNGMNDFPVLALRLAAGLGEYWDTRCMSKEAKYWMESLLLATNGNEVDYLPALTSIVKAELGRVLFRLGDYAGTLTISEELMNGGRSSDNKYALVDGIMLQCMVAAHVQDQTSTLSLSEEGLQLARELNYKIAIIDILEYVAATASLNGENEKAVRLTNECIDLARLEGASRWEAIALVLRGFGLFNLQKVREAENSFLEAIELCLNLNDNLLITYSILGLAQVALARNEPVKGISLIGAMERHTEESGTAVVPMIKFMFSRTEEVVISQVGEEVFLSLKKEGKKLSLEEACTLAGAALARE